VTSSATTPRATAWLVAITLTVAACSGGGGLKRGKDGHVTAAGDLSVFDLQAGDCVVPSTETKSELEKVRVVACKDAHTQEVFAVEQYDHGDTYPGDQALAQFADGICLHRYQDYLPSPVGSKLERGQGPQDHVHRHDDGRSAHGVGQGLEAVTSGMTFAVRQ